MYTNGTYKTANVETVKKVYIFNYLKDGIPDESLKRIRLYGSTRREQREFLEKHFESVNYYIKGRKHKTYNNPTFVADDEDVMANMYIEYLFKKGYEIHFVDNGDTDSDEMYYKNW